MRVDILVLGGGIVGTALALSLQMRGRSVAMVDRGAPGGETSFGNAGLIQTEAVMPYPFPRDPILLLQYALNLKAEANYHLKDLFEIAPALWRYFRASTPEGRLVTAKANAPLFKACIAEHRKLAVAAGAEAQLRPGGWIDAYRSQASLEASIAEASQERAAFGITSVVLDGAALRAKEPNLSEALIGAIHWTDPYSLNDPEALTLAYARHFQSIGGKILVGDARTLAQQNNDWSVTTQDGSVSAPDCVIALGPWSPDILRPLGYDVPMFVKRGYHVHLTPQGNARLSVPVADRDVGYMMAPMARGIRLTSGAEFASRDSVRSPIQIAKIEAKARELFPFGGRVEAEPWMGARPCMPDMRPVMGRAGKHKGLWLNFGHAHHGLTLAGSSARILTEMMLGEPTFADARPFELERFG